MQRLFASSEKYFETRTDHLLALLASLRLGADVFKAAGQGSRV
jgi:hypothetical protein